MVKIPWTFQPEGRLKFKIKARRYLIIIFKIKLFDIYNLKWFIFLHHNLEMLNKII